MAFADPLGVTERDAGQPQPIPDYKKELLGDDARVEILGPPTHELVALKWAPIFKHGLTKEMLDLFTKKYPAPKNLALCQAPILDTKVRRHLPAISIKRDDYQYETQSIIGSSIAAQAVLMSQLLKPEASWDAKRIFESASDAARITSHVQYHMSMTRRSLITPMLSVAAKAALENSPIDRKLFGEEFLPIMKESSAADKLVKSLTASTVSVVKPNPPAKKPLQYSKPGNSTAPVKKSYTPRQTGKYKQKSRRRSSSRSSRPFHRS